MNRVTRVLLAAAAITVLGAPVAAFAQKKALLLKAERAGWMMGMYVGEKAQNPHPFVLQVDKASDAYRKGIREGDELIRFNGYETTPLWRVFDEVNRTRPGREMTIWVRRGAETLRYFVRVPKDPGAPPGEKVEASKKKEGEETAEGTDDKNKKKSKKKTIVVKPIPADEDK